MNPHSGWSRAQCIGCDAFQGFTPDEQVTCLACQEKLDRAIAQSHRIQAYKREIMTPGLLASLEDSRVRAARLQGHLVPIPRDRGYNACKAIPEFVLFDGHGPRPVVAFSDSIDKSHNDLLGQLTDGDIVLPKFHIGV
jgi:hypothetical protein